MSTSNRYAIACYMAWCGAEATFVFDTKEEYDSITSSLDEIAVGRVRKNKLPEGYAKVSDLYFIDVKDRAAFKEIMRSSK